MLCKPVDWFLYDNGLRHERVKQLKNEKRFRAEIKSIFIFLKSFQMLEDVSFESSL